MSLRTLADLLLGRHPITISRRTPAGIAHVVTGRLVSEDAGRLVVDDGEAVHHVHLHADLLVGRA